MLFNISAESMKKYENQIVDIECTFKWTDKGYKIIVDDLIRDRIARVKHLSQRTLENMTIMNGKKYKDKRPHSECFIFFI